VDLLLDSVICMGYYYMLVSDQTVPAVNGKLRVLNLKRKDVKDDL
jgi:hypothetical protein